MKHGQGVLQEFSESMYQRFGVQVAILAGYCDCQDLSVTDTPLCVYFQVVIIRYDKMAHDRGIVHMTVTCAYIITCLHVTVG